MSDEGHSATATRRGSALRRLLAAIVLALVAVAAVVLVVLSAAPDDEDAGVVRRTKLLDRHLQRRQGDAGLAVVLRVAPGENSELNASADALCESLVEALSRRLGRRVTTCASAQVAAAAGLGPAQLASLLRVNQIIDGELARDPDGGLVLRSAVYDHDSGRRTLRFDEQGDDMLLQRLPHRIAARLARGGDAAQPTPIDVSLYRRYLKALQFGRRGNVDDLRQALALHDEVLAAAPDYAPALVSRLFAAAGLRSLTGVRDGPEHDSEREDVAQRLLRVDPDSVHARLVLAEIAVTQRDWRRAFALVDEALARNPHDPRVLRYQALVLVNAGYLQQARAVALRAAQADPMSANSFRHLANIDILLGEDERMLEQIAFAQELGLRGTQVYRAFAALRRADRAEAETQFRATLREFGAAEGWVAPVVAAALDPAQRAAGLRALDAESAQSRAAMDGFMVFYAAVGAPERALQALLSLALGRRSDWTNHVWSPEMAAVRRLDGFAQYVDAMAFAPLWDARGAPDRCRRAAGGYVCD